MLFCRPTITFMSGLLLKTPRSPAPIHVGLEVVGVPRCKDPHPYVRPSLDQLLKVPVDLRIWRPLGFEHHGLAREETGLSSVVGEPAHVVEPLSIVPATT